MIVERLDGPFGVRVKGLDLSAGADAALIRRLAELLYRHRVVAIAGQSLTEDQYLAFGRQWGRPHPHALVHKRMAGYPEMMIVGNTFKRAANDTPAVFWHTDQSYEAEPAGCTMLYAVMAPEVGGETAFADMVAAYAALDEETQRQIEPLEAMHFYGAASGRDGENKASALLADQRRAVPPVPHRLVRRHPVTGHKALYAVAGTPFSVKGMDDAAAAALLERLKRHALQPRFTSKYKYSVGDIAIWDTLSTLHSATPIKPATGPNDSRLLWRISCKGLPTGFAARPADRAA
jgi:taurine dioxygenase